MIIEKLHDFFLECGGISTDTRSLQKNDLFFALKGPNFNANAFAKEALEKGARYAVIDESEYATDQRMLLVPDALRALQQLATHHRLQFDIPVIGITGSNGKTTTRALTCAVLNTRYQTLCTRGNLNNHIGVPLMLLELKKHHELAVIEMGANRVGDIAELTAIAQPTHGLITNIGKAHLETFGGVEGIVRGKSELYDYLLKQGGTVFINMEDPRLAPMARRFPEEKRVEISKQDPLYPRRAGAGMLLQFQTENQEVVTTQLTGTYNLANIAAALFIGKSFGIATNTATHAIGSYQPSNSRSQVITTEAFVLISDAYNANPTSMRHALKNLGEMEAHRKGVILGEMLELGEASPEEHRMIGNLLKEMAPDFAILFGEDMQYAHEVYPQAVFAQNRETLKNEINKLDLSDSVILVKGSRGNALESVIDQLQKSK